jgi:hypothetical protein
MLLGAHETVVRSAYAVLERGHADPSRRRPGVLYLTSDRLVFEAPGSRGVVHGTDPDLLLDVPLERLRNVSVREGRLAKPRLVVEVDGRRTAFDVLEPHPWSLAIAETRRASQLGREPAPVALPSPRTGPTVKLRCRYCGSLGDESAHRCPSCGAPW